MRKCRWRQGLILLLQLLFDDGLKDLSKGACFFFFFEKESGNLELVNCLGVFRTFVKGRDFMIFQPQLAAEKLHISSRC